MIPALSSAIADQCAKRLVESTPRCGVTPVCPGFQVTIPRPNLPFGPLKSAGMTKPFVDFT